jgi:hypothetical protein
MLAPHQLFHSLCFSSRTSDLAEKIQKVESEISDVKTALGALAAGGKPTGFLEDFSKEQLKDRLSALQQMENALLQGKNALQQKEIGLLALRRAELELEAAKAARTGVALIWLTWTSYTTHNLRCLLLHP